MVNGRLSFSLVCVVFKGRTPELAALRVACWVLAIASQQFYYCLLSTFPLSQCFQLWLGLVLNRPDEQRRIFLTRVAVIELGLPYSLRLWVL